MSDETLRDSLLHPFDLTGPQAGLQHESEPPGDDTNIAQRVTKLYEEYSASLIRHGTVLSGSEDIAREAVQEAFLRFFVARQNGRLPENGRSWLFKAVRDHLEDRLNKAGGRIEVNPLRAARTSDLGQSPDMSQRRADLVRRMRRSLSPRELECIQLRAEGLRYEEIAEVLGIRRGTVGAVLFRAARKMRTVLREDPGSQ